MPVLLFFELSGKLWIQVLSAEGLFSKLSTDDFICFFFEMYYNTLNIRDIRGNMSEIILGIDLGTTYSVCTTLDSKEPVIIPTKEGKNKTPSVVGFKSKNDILVGELAKRQSAIAPLNTVFSVKRFIGKKYSDIEPYISLFPFKIKAGKNREIIIETEYGSYTPEQVSSFILARIKKEAEDFLGHEVQNVILTVPAYFNNHQREKTKAAAELAGLKVLRLINEPTAAALAYSYKKKTAETVAVYDLGGGTFDLSILHLDQSTCEVIATGGDTFLGGDDIDAAILNLVVADFKEKSGYDLRQNRNALVRLKEACEQAKCELSQLSETDITLPFIASHNNNPLHLNYTLKSSSLEKLLLPFISKSLKITEEVLSSADLKASNIDRIILAGGSTRIPLVINRVEDFFQKKTFRGINPDEVVAVGAVIQGGVLSGSLAEILLLDVTPVNLGVETVNDRFSVIIERNSTIPTQKSKIFTTTHDNQALVPIHILQGTSKQASKNISLGYYTLSGIPPSRKGQPRIEVAFSIDGDGILEVYAFEKRSGASLKVNLSPTMDHHSFEPENVLPEDTTHVPVHTSATSASDNKTDVNKAPDAISTKNTAPVSDSKKKQGEQVVPVDIVKNKKLIDEYINRGDYEKTREFLKTFYKQNKDTLPYIIEKYEQLMKNMKEKPASFYAEIAHYYKLSSQLEKSADLLEKARDIDSSDPHVTSKLISIYHEILKERPNDHGIKLKLGKLLYFNNSINSAITYLQQAALSPDNHQEASKYLGMAFFKKKLYYISLQQLKKCPLDEDIKDILYSLYQSFEEEGQYVNAVYCLEHILAEDINYRNAMQEYNRLKKRSQDEKTVHDVPSSSEKSSLDHAGHAKNNSILGSRFIHLKELNRGSMGVVYRAYDTALDENVVLKILADTLARDPEALKRFKREARATRKLSHPNIVRIFDFGEINRIKYISMEYIEGRDLKKVLRTHGRLPEKQVIFYAKQVCFALQYAHEKGIIHRDIKPANILLTNDDVIKISDFGIAKSIQSTTEVTKVGEIVGTPLYMSPEQITSFQVDFRADIYSLGVVMYEMITGSPPFIEGDITFHHMNTTPEPPKYCSPELETIIMKCLQKKLSLRYQSISEIVEVFMKTNH